MNKRVGLIIILEILIVSVYYYFMLPVINFSSIEFWSFIIFILGTLTVLMFIFGRYKVNNRINFKSMLRSLKLKIIPLFCIIFIICMIAIVNFFVSPLFNAKSYSRRITIDETGNFTEDIEEVNFKSLPLLDRESSEKLGDRVMGGMSDLVSQFYVSDNYTQINYNNDIIRVTPLEYADVIKWLSNRKKGVTGYITVDSVNGKSKLVKLDKGMKYMPSAHFNEKLIRKLRFKYPTSIFGESKFEIDNDGNPYWITPVYKYTGFGLKTKVVGVIILNPIDGSSKKYKIEKVPEWVDNAYDANLIIEQVDDWGTYRGGFLNSIFGQKNVVNTTDGYNYLAMNDDIYLYTGITSVLSDESNLGFILSNMRTGKTVFYSAPGAEEYSAMASAEGQVQQMKYKSTFPLLINLNDKPTYLVSLKDAAGLVKMYGLVDVTDYQKVTVTDAGKGIENTVQNYLKEYAEEVKTDLLEKKEIKIKRLTTATLNGTTYFYITDEKGIKYKASIELGDELAFLNIGDTLSISCSDNKKDIIEVIAIY